MNNTSARDNILQECINRLENGETIQDCLTRYPEHAAELATLLGTVTALRSIAVPPPRSEATRAAARATFLVAVERQQKRLVVSAPAPAQSWISWLGRPLQLPRWAPALGALLLAVLLIRATMLASASSLPGDSLYSIKLVSEQLQLMLTRDKVQRASLEAHFEEQRRQEAQMIVKLKRPAWLSFSGVTDEVTSEILRIGGLVVHLKGGVTQIKGALRVGYAIQVIAISSGTGDLTALEVQVMGIPTPQPVPTPADMSTVAPTPRPIPTRATRLRPQEPQHRTNIVPPATPTALSTPTLLPRERVLLTSTTVLTPLPETPMVAVTTSPMPEITPTMTGTPAGGRLLPTPTAAIMPSPETPTVEVTVPPSPEMTLVVTGTPTEGRPLPTHTPLETTAAPTVEPVEDTPTPIVETPPTWPPAEATPTPAPTMPPLVEPTATPVPLPAGPTATPVPTPAPPPPTQPAREPPTPTPPPPIRPVRKPPTPTPVPPPPPTVPPPPPTQPARRLPTPTPSARE